MKFHAFAPGKVVILGEYAVLDDAPAIVAAIDHGVTVDVQLGGESVQVVSNKDPRFVNAVFQHTPPANGAYTFADSHSYSFDGKPGFGGSAAATVAATIASLRSHGEEVSPRSTLEIAHAVHRRVQGSGSGIDIAAASFGGVIRFENKEPTALSAPEPVIIWSGNSAKTGPRVKRYLDWSERSSFVAQSREAVDRFKDDPVGALQLGFDALSRMADSAGVDWMTSELHHICDLARRCGGAAKPSGAGGGDCAIAFFHDNTQHQEFLNRCVQSNFTVIPVNYADGFRISEPSYD